MSKDPVDIDALDHDLESFKPQPVPEYEHQFDFNFTKEETKKTLDKIKRDMEKKNENSN